MIGGVGVYDTDQVGVGRVKVYFRHDFVDTWLKIWQVSLDFNGNFSSIRGWRFEFVFVPKSSSEVLVHWCRFDT